MHLLTLCGIFLQTYNKKDKFWPDMRIIYFRHHPVGTGNVATISPSDTYRRTSLPERSAFRVIRTIQHRRGADNKPAVFNKRIASFR